MLVGVRAEGPEGHGIDRDQLSRLEALSVRLDGALMRGGTFLACVERDFEEILSGVDGFGAERPPRVNVRGNAVFLDEARACCRG